MVNSQIYDDMLQSLITTFFCFISFISIHSQVIDSVKFQYSYYECIEDSSDNIIGKYYRHYLVKGVNEETNHSNLDFLVVLNNEITVLKGDTTQTSIPIAKNKKEFSLKTARFKDFLEQINDDISIENTSQNIDQSKLLKYLRSNTLDIVDKGYYKSLCDKMSNKDTIQVFFETNFSNSQTLGKRKTPCKEHKYDFTVFYKDSVITYFSTSSDTYMQPYYRVLQDTIPRVPIQITNLKTNELLSKYLIVDNSIKEIFSLKYFYTIYREYWLKKWEIIGH